MKITDEELKNLLYNPNLIQQHILSELYSQENKAIVNATSPFVMLLESTATLASSLGMESRNLIRKKFPHLALTKEDLFPHLTDNEVSNIFATPAECNFTFFLEVTSLKNFGYRSTNGDYIETQIPKGTVISVHDYSFTILNPILIRLSNKTESPYVEVRQSQTKLAYQHLSLVNSKVNPQVTHGNLPIPFIEFSLPVKQVTRKTVTATINKSTSCIVKVPLTDKYCTSSVIVNGASTSNRNVEIEQTFTQDYLDPTKAKVYVTLGDNEVIFKIPDIYIRSGLVSGTVTITVYETKGRLNLPMKGFNLDEYSIKYGDPETDQEQTIINNIQIVTKSSDSIMGGRDPLTLEELKNSLINNTTGSIDVPITDYQIVKLGSDMNYSIEKIEDSLTHRKYSAYKPLPYPDRSTQIKAMPDVFINRVGLMLDQIKENFKDNIRGNSFLINAKTVFRVLNGKLLLVTNKELEDNKKMDILNSIYYYKENKYFYNPFTYVVDMSEETTKTKIYHLENPKMSGLRFLDKNMNLVDINASIEKYAVRRIPNGYEVIIKILGDTGYNKIDKSLVRLQLALPTTNGNNVYYSGVYSDQDERFHFNIETSDFITKDNEIQLLNGVSENATKHTGLKTTMQLLGYVVDPLVNDPTQYLVGQIKDDNPNKTSLFLISINLEFGKEIKYLWSETYSSYTDRKFKRYKEDVYKTYESNVYQKDVNGLLMFEKDNNNEIKTIKLHSKGDRVLDEHGEPIKLHSKGDVILDSEGSPIIDSIPGVIKYLDILMLEYEFSLVTSTEGSNLNLITTNFFEEILFKELPSLNEKLLEQTEIYYKPYKSIEPINIKANGMKYTVPYVVKPVVSLYINSDTNISLNELDVYKTAIGTVINQHLNSNRINVNAIKEDIKAKVAIGIQGIKIENIAPVETEIITVENNNRLTLAKELFFTEYNETIVKYDIELKLIKL